MEGGRQGRRWSVHHVAQTQHTDEISSWIRELILRASAGQQGKLSTARQWISRSIKSLTTQQWPDDRPKYPSTTAFHPVKVNARTSVQVRDDDGALEPWHLSLSGTKAWTSL